MGIDIPVGAGVVAAVLSVDDEEEDEDTGTVPGFVHPDTVINAAIIRMKVK